MKEGVKVRKKPLPRVTKPPGTDAIGAAKKKHTITPEWVIHPGSNGKYKFALNISLVNGHPLFSTDTDMVVGVMDSATCRPLDDEDIKSAISQGLIVDKNASF